MTINLQQRIRQLVQDAESEDNEIIRKSLMTAAWILEVADETLNYQPKESSLETCLGHQLEPVIDDKDTTLLKKLGFTPFKKSTVLNKKILFVDAEGTRILFSRNRYNEHYPNDAPFVGNNIEEISLINECDYIVVARYGDDKNADYIDGAAFDVRVIKLTISADNKVEFLPPIPTATIFIPQTGDWVKLNNLERKEC